MHPGDRELHVHHALMNAYITHINWKWDWNLAPFPPVSGQPLGLQITFTNLSLSQWSNSCWIISCKVEQLKERVKTSASHTPDESSEAGRLLAGGSWARTEGSSLGLCQSFSPSRGRFCWASSQVKGGSISSMEERILLYFGTYFLFVCLIFYISKRLSCLVPGAYITVNTP